MNPILPVSVVIPSRLQRDAHGDLLALRAVASIMKGTRRPTEILLGIDKGVVVPKDDARKLQGWVNEMATRICAVAWDGQGHQGATNAAALRATGKYLAFLEDDDEWHPHRLEATMDAVEKAGAHFVSCSQQEVSDGIDARKNDFATASGWLLSRDLWLSLGGFDEEYKIHHDGAFLGKVNARKLKRVHLVEEGAKREEREWLRNVEAHARIMAVPGIKECLVIRHINDDGVMANAAKDAARGERSKREYEAQMALFGYYPW